MNRPSIPAAIRRQVITEAGDRCAIPTCRQFPVEVAHITPWAETKDHSAANLVALCPTCHSRFDSGQIRRDHIRIYKANTLTNISRFNGFENAILDVFITDFDAQHSVAENLMFLLMRLNRDGLVDLFKNSSVSTRVGGVSIDPVFIRLPPKGREYLSLLKKGRELV